MSTSQILLQEILFFMHNCPHWSLEDASAAIIERQSGSVSENSINEEIFVNSNWIVLRSNNDVIEIVY